MGCLRFKPGVSLEPMGVGGALIVAALAQTAIRLECDLTVTSGADGVHSGPTDPHALGNADDVRSHDMPTAEKQSVLRLVMGSLAALSRQLTGQASMERLVDVSGGLANELFFGFLEDAGGANEHFHFQVRKGRTLPTLPALNA